MKYSKTMHKLGMICEYGENCGFNRGTFARDMDYCFGKHTWEFYQEDKKYAKTAYFHEERLRSFMSDEDIRKGLDEEEEENK